MMDDLNTPTRPQAAPRRRVHWRPGAIGALLAAALATAGATGWWLLVPALLLAGAALLAFAEEPADE